jgi:hypothetical protein
MRLAQVPGVLKKTNRDLRSEHWKLEWKPTVARITEIEGFEKDYVDLCGPAKIEISTRGTGSIKFGAIEGYLDCKMDDFDDLLLQFSFEGEDEGDRFCGRGYCFTEGGELIGRLFRHYGDDFRFKAKRQKK